MNWFYIIFRELYFMSSFTGTTDCWPVSIGLYFTVENLVVSVLIYSFKYCISLCTLNWIQKPQNRVSSLFFRAIYFIVILDFLKSVSDRLSLRKSGQYTWWHLLLDSGKIKIEDLHIFKEWVIFCENSWIIKYSQISDV